MDERCISCGRGTGPGTRLFTSRKRGRDQVTGSEGFLCQTCQPSLDLARDQADVPLSGRYVVIDLPGGYPG